MPYNKNIKVNARNLRSHATDEENKLWYQFLRAYPIRFMRQRIIDSYILDFYCSKCRLGIELDGGQHFSETGKGQDEARTQLLNTYGVAIIRFTNWQVREEFNTVCKAIDTKVKELTARP